jgi:hypothetical protein
MKMILTTLRKKLYVFLKTQNTIYKAIIIILSAGLLYNYVSDFSFLSTILLGISLFISTYLLKITNAKF